MRILLVFCFLLFIFSSFSQERFQGNIKVGLTASQISGDDSNGFAQFGFYGGVGVHYQLNEPWLISTGIYLNQKGARRFQSLGPVSDYRLRVNYIDLPFEVGYSWKSWLFLAGLSGNVRVNQRESTSFGEVEDQRIFKPFELALQGGIAYLIRENWHVQLSYQNSLLPVRDHSPTYFNSSVVNTLIEEWHQNWINKGQYFSLFMLSLVYDI